MGGKWVTEMQQANEVGDSKKVWKAVKNLSGKVNVKPPANLTESQGETIDSPHKLSAVWRTFLEKKFISTENEKRRDPMEPPTSTERPEK